MEEYLDCPDDSRNLFRIPYPDLFFKVAESNGAMRNLVLQEEFLGRTSSVTLPYVLLDSQYSWRISHNEIADNPPRLVRVNSDLSKLVSLAISEGMTGFHVGEKLFIIPQHVPDEFIPFVVRHEHEECGWGGFHREHAMNFAERMHNEGIYSDDEIRKVQDNCMALEVIYPHIAGCRCELTDVFIRGKDFAERYANWLFSTNGDINESSNFFNQVVPKFLARNGRDGKNSLQVLIEFFLVLHKLEHGSGPLKEYEYEDHIKKFPWIAPYIPKGSLEDPLEFVKTH